jgi:hypothetical protein
MPDIRQILRIRQILPKQRPAAVDTKEAGTQRPLVKA